MTSVTAFASFESLSKNADRPSRTYYVGEEVVFSAKIENTGPYINTYYYIEDVFYGDLDYVTLYRDGNGDADITFDGGGNVVAPDYELVLNTDYFIDNGKIILRWIDGVGDPEYVGYGTPFQQIIPTFPGMGDNMLILSPGQFAYIELHYIVQPEDVGFVFNEINTLGEDSAPDKLSANVTAWFKAINPDTMVNISASAITVYAGDTVDLTITEQNTGDDPLTNVYVELYKDASLHSTLDKDSAGFTGDVNANGKLDVGETWQWIVTGVTVSADTNFEVLGFGTDSLGNEISYEEGYLGEKDDVDVYVIDPDTMVSIIAEIDGASVSMVSAGDSVDLVITEENTGNDQLTNVYVEVYQGGSLIATLDETSLEYTGGDNGNGILDVGETWSWKLIGVIVNAETKFEVLGFGTDSLGSEVSYAEGYMDEKAEVTVYVMQTRDETAWAYDPRNGEDATISNGYSTPFTKMPKSLANFNNWGWTNGPYELGEEEDFVLDLYAGAGLNIISPEKMVGHVYVEFTGDSIIVTYELFENCYLDEVHLFIGKTMLPKLKSGRLTNAPGSFPYDEGDGVLSNYNKTFTIELSFEELGLESGDLFYIAAHAVVEIPME
jgi:hypothetical protein